MKKCFYILILLLAGKFSFAQNDFIIRFEHIANGKELVLNDSTYSTDAGEAYTIKKLKYYVSNIHLVGDHDEKFAPNIFLIDASHLNEFKIPRIPGKIKGIEFTLGVDSILNCSGAQTGALDPLNDMFWTWNSGYVMFKLEGNAPLSKADQHRVEIHIGGYKGEYKTMRKVFIPASINFTEGFFIALDLDLFWKNQQQVRLNDYPVLTTPGSTASAIADTFNNMFFFSRQRIVF